jgi:FkbM family methyltransferase
MGIWDRDLTGAKRQRPTMDEVYSPGQVKVLWPFLRRDPSWFVLGGPANGDEAQCFALRYPTDCRILGIEPSLRMRRHQLEHNFPGTLIAAGLDKHVGVRPLHSPAGAENCSSMVRDCGGDVHEVPTTTLDAIDADYHFANAVLWLDIEGMELPALRGASACLRRGAFELINVEILVDERPDDLTGIADLLTTAGMELVHEWDWQMAWRNQIWRLKEQPT